MRIANPSFGVDAAGGERLVAGNVDWLQDPIALFSNSKPNARLLLEGVRDSLGSFRSTDNIDYFFKDSAAKPAPEELYDEVAASYKGAIVALAVTTGHPKSVVRDQRSRRRMRSVLLRERARAGPLACLHSLDPCQELRESATAAVHVLRHRLRSGTDGSPCLVNFTMRYVRHVVVFCKRYDAFINVSVCNATFVSALLVATTRMYRVACVAAVAPLAPLAYVAGVHAPAARPLP